MACAVATGFQEPSGDFPAWLEAQGVNAEVARAMDSELGIRDYGVLRACVGDGLVRAELLATARDRLPFGFYAVLRQVVKALQGEEANDDDPATPLWDDDDDDADATFSPGDVTTGGLVEALIELFSGLSRELMLCVQRLSEWDGVNFPTMSSATEAGSPEDVRLGAADDLGASAAGSSLTRAATPAEDELVDCAAEGEADELQFMSDELVSDDQTMTIVKLETDAAEEKIASNVNDSSSSRKERAVNKAEPYDGKRNSRPFVGDARPLRAARSDASRVHNSRRLPRSHQRPAAAASNAASGSSNPAAATGRTYAPEHLAMGYQLVDWDAAGADEVLPAKFAGAGEEPQAAAAPARHGCTVCGKTFSMRCNLTHHQRLHTGEKPYRCKLCGQEFSRMGTLKLHERTHTGEKPYRCDMCNQDFSQMGSLKRHQRKHTCGPSFAWKNAPKEQERAYAAERPFGCDACGLSFAQASSLRFHQCQQAGAIAGFQ